jgi:hypothetical protein
MPAAAQLLHCCCLLPALLPQPPGVSSY